MLTNRRTDLCARRRAKTLRKIRYVRKSISGLKVTSRGQSVARGRLGGFLYGLATSEAVQAILRASPHAHAREVDASSEAPEGAAA